MTQKRVLLINDDTADALAVQQRLPADLEILIASQSQARSSELTGFDLVVLDNDANELREAKGPETLVKLRSYDTQVPVLYTSFQPGWVDPAVFQTKGVQVVKTDEVLETLATRLGASLVPRVETDKAEPQTNIILTYNPVTGYTPGTYANGKLLIVSYDKHAKDYAKRFVKEALGKMYQEFDMRADRDRIRNVFVYDGINGQEMPGIAAASLGHDMRMVVNLLACGCDWDRKSRFANSMYVELSRVRCGGSEELGAIADVILGVQRPYTESVALPLSKEAILAPAKKFAV